MESAHLALSVVTIFYTVALGLMVIKGIPIARRDPEGFDNSWLNVGILLLNLLGFIVLLAQGLTGPRATISIVFLVVSVVSIAGIHGWVRLVGLHEKDDIRNYVAGFCTCLLVISNMSLAIFC